MNTKLLAKYNIPVPRYTSYPTVPYWQTTPPSAQEWKTNVLRAFEENQEISLYIHLPFCESLCTYCGCNKRITRNHAVEAPYIKTVLQEWRLYTELLPSPPVIKELHLGGGTPTFFSPLHLNQLIEGIMKNARPADNADLSVEVHPGVTSKAHLETLRSWGFNRISIGIQDFAPEILEIVNRKQTFEDVKQCTDWAREMGYESINYDLIFGLPLQTRTHIRQTMEKVKSLRPDRIAFYSYAHVPWIKPSQRAYSEADLPLGKAKRALYELGRTLLENQGYEEIGLDHFALPDDALYQAQKNGTLHRNFMGYTPYATTLNLALGASAIGDSFTAYVQNEKKIEAYSERIAKGKFPIIKGHLLSEEDQILRRHITNIMCSFETSWKDEKAQCESLFAGVNRFLPLEEDELISLQPLGVKVNPAGRPFIRNICMALDARYWRRQAKEKLFSQAV